MVGPCFETKRTGIPGSSEGGAFVADVFTESHRDPRMARELLARKLAEHARSLEAIAMQVEKDSGWSYMGLDATPAPGPDSSIGAAIQQFRGEAAEKLKTAGGIGAFLR